MKRPIHLILGISRNSTNSYRQPTKTKLLGFPFPLLVTTKHTPSIRAEMLMHLRSNAAKWAMSRRKIIRSKKEIKQGGKKVNEKREQGELTRVQARHALYPSSNVELASQRLDLPSVILKSGKNSLAQARHPIRTMSPDPCNDCEAVELGLPDLVLTELIPPGSRPWIWQSGLHQAR